MCTYVHRRTHCFVISLQTRSLACITLLNTWGLVPVVPRVPWEPSKHSTWMEGSELKPWLEADGLSLCVVKWQGCSWQRRPPFCFSAASDSKLMNPEWGSSISKEKVLCFLCWSRKINISRGTSDMAMRLCRSAVNRWGWWMEMANRKDRLTQSPLWRAHESLHRIWLMVNLTLFPPKHISRTTNIDSLLGTYQARMAAFDLKGARKKLSVNRVTLCDS